MDPVKAFQLYRQFSISCQETDFDLFFNESRDLVHRVAYHYVKCASESEDVIQSVYLKLFLYGKEQPKKINEIDNFKSWLISVVVNVSKMAIRKEARQKERDSEKTMSEPNQNEDQVELMDKIKATIGILPEKYRLPVCLHYIEDLSFKDMSSILKTEAATLKVQASRGVQKIREHLEKTGVTLSVVSLEVLLRKNIYTNTPQNIVLHLNNMKPSTRLDKILQTSDAKSVFNFNLFFKFFITISIFGSLAFAYYFFTPNQTTASITQKETSTQNINKEVKSKEFELSYNFTSQIANGVSLKQIENANILPGKGLSIPSGNTNTFLNFSEISLDKMPFVIEEEVFTYQEPAMIYGMFGLAEPENIWFRPVATLGNQWNHFAIYLYKDYEISFMNYRPFRIQKLKIQPNELSAPVNLIFNNVILKKVLIRSLKNKETNDLEEFLNSKLNIISKDLSQITIEDLSDTNFKGILTLGAIKHLYKPLKIKFEFTKKVTSFKDFQILFMDSNDSPTKMIYGKVPEQYVPSNKFTVYICDGIAFIGAADLDPDIYFESESRELNPECAFVISRELIKSIKVESISNEKNFYKLTNQLFSIPSGTKKFTTKTFQEN